MLGALPTRIINAALLLLALGVYYHACVGVIRARSGFEHITASSIVSDFYSHPEAYLWYIRTFEPNGESVVPQLNVSTLDDNPYLAEFASWLTPHNVRATPDFLANHCGEAEIELVIAGPFLRSYSGA